MRTVVNSGEVAHIWAHQTQETARNSGDTVSFQGKLFYSYSTVIASMHDRRRPIKDTQIGTLILLNERDYSVTTTQHKSSVVSAISPAPIISVPKLGNSYRLDLTAEEHRENCQYLKNKIVEWYGKHERAIKHDYTYAINVAVKDYQLYRAFFGLGKDKVCKDPFHYNINVQFGYSYAPNGAEVSHAYDNLQAVCEMLGREYQALTRKRQRAVENEKKKEQKRRDDYIKRLEEWRVDFNVRLPHENFSNRPIALRVNGEDIETSLGARVSIKSARLLWLRIEKCVETKQEWRANGERIKVGVYNVNSISDIGTLVAGCHTIMYREMHWIASSLQWPVSDAGKELLKVTK